VNKVSRSNLFYAFKPDLTPVLHISPGEEVLLETHDCFQGQIRTPQDLVSNLDWSHTNPATGPVFVEGARPGDLLRLDILEVEIDEQSFMVAIPGEGALGDVITDMETAVLKRKGGELVYKGGIHFPLRIMIGVIGVAPKDETIPNGVPGFHGGNLDCTLVRAGSKIYLTVQQEGGLFGAGDLHAAMGDGEIVVCGAEVPGMVRLRPELISLPGLPTPFIETDELVVTVHSDPDLQKAVDGAIHRMSDFLTGIVGLSQNDAGMLMSAVGELKFCQVVDPAKTTRFEFPKAVLDQLGFSMPA
jgi:amidase